MAPGRHDMVIRRGDPWELQFSALLDDVAVPIDPNLVLCQARNGLGGVLVADLAAHVTVSVAPDGQDIGFLTLSPAETAALLPGRWVWDLQPDPGQDTWVEGYVEISLDISIP